MHFGNWKQTLTSFFRENECKQKVLRGVPVLDSIVFKLLSMAPGSSCNTSILPTVLLLRSLDRSTTNRSIIPISSKRKLIFFHFFPPIFSLFTFRLIIEILPANLDFDGKFWLWVKKLREKLVNLMSDSMQEELCVGI